MAVKISRSFLHVSLILTFVLPLQGEIFLPSFGNTTFVNEGSDVEIPWTYNFEGREVAFATWTFINNTVEEQLALLSLETNRLTTSTIFPNINVTGQATLVLKNVNRYYNGRYRLTITVRSGSPPRPSYVMVIVKVRPTAVANCSNVEVNEGDEIRCLGEGKHGNPPASVSWIKDNVTVAGPESLQVLLVKTVDRSDRGTYVCKAVSVDLQSEAVATLNVFWPPTNLSISVMPASVVLGVRATLTCKADAFPAAQLRIVFNGKNVSRNGTYVIQSAAPKDAGTYQCFATNRLGSNSTNRTIIVAVRPTAVTNCSNMEVIEGDEMRCLCEGKHRNPPASVSWIKDGVTVAGPGSLQVLLVKTVGRNDAGTYICKARSLDLEDSVSVQVTVKLYRPPTNLSISVMPASVVSGDRVTLTCKADAFPAAQLRIVFNGKNVSDNGTYVIQSVGSEDLGTYECIATNRLGSNSVNRAISVAATPSHTKSTSDSLSGGAIAGIVIGVLVLLVIVALLVWWRKFKDRKDALGVHYDVDSGGNKDPTRGESQNGTAEEAKPTNGKPSGTLPSTNGSGDAPPVYAAVDKSKKTTNPDPTVQYAFLNAVDEETDGSKMGDSGPPQETSYATIDFEGN